MSTREKDIEAALADIRGGSAQTPAGGDDLDAALAEIRGPTPRRRRQPAVRRAINWFLGDSGREGEQSVPAPAPSSRRLARVTNPQVLTEQGQRTYDLGMQLDPEGTTRSVNRIRDAFTRSQGTPIQRLGPIDPRAMAAPSDATSTPRQREAERRAATQRRPGSTVGPDTRSESTRRLARERADRVEALRRRPSVVRKLDAAGAEGSEMLTLGYRDELLGAVTPGATSEDYRAKAEEHRESRTTGDTVAGLAGAFAGVALPIAGQNALLARAAGLAKEGTALRAGLEAFGHTTARSRTVDALRGAVEGIPYDLAFDYERPGERPLNLMLGAAGGALAGAVLRVKPRGAAEGAAEAGAAITERDLRTAARGAAPEVGDALRNMADLLRERRDPADYVRSLSPEVRSGVSRALEVPDTGWLANVEEMGARRLAREAAERDGTAPDAATTPAAPVPAPVPVEARSAGTDGLSAQGAPLDAARRIAEAGERPTIARVMRETGASQAEAREAVRAVREGAPTAPGADVPRGTLAAEEPPPPSRVLGGVAGRETPVSFPDGGRVQARYRVVEADDLQPSHHPISFQPNPEYPAGVQGRDYHRDVAAQERVAEHTTGFDPERLLDPTHLVVSGPPVVTPSGAAVAGNERTMLRQRVRALNPDADAAYRQGLVERASYYGIDPAGIEGMRHPMLVRELADDSLDLSNPEVLRELNTRSDQEVGKVKDPLSDAATRARQMRGGQALQHFSSTFDSEQSLRDYLGGAQGRRFVQELVNDGVIPRAEMPRYIDTRTGALNAQGAALVERSLYLSAVPDPDIVDAVQPSLLQQLEPAVPHVVQAAQVPGWDISPVLRDAMGLFVEARGKGLKTVDDLLANTEMFGRQVTPGAEDLARFLEGANRKQTREFFQRYAEAAQLARRMAQSDDLFGELPPEQVETFRRLFTGEHGLAEQAMVNLLARTGAGAAAGGAVGGSMDDEDPVRGAVLGALAGMALAAGISLPFRDDPAAFARLRARALALQEDIRGRPRTAAGFVSTTADELADTPHPSELSRERTGFPLSPAGRGVQPLDAEPVAEAISLAAHSVLAGRRLPVDVDARFPGVGLQRADGAAIQEMMHAVARTSAGAALGATQGDTPEERLTNAALFGALGAGVPAIRRFWRGMDQIGAVGPRDPLGRTTFYSRLEQAIASGQKAAPAEQWLRYLDNRPEGIARGEREWTGVDEYLRSRRGERVTQEELAQYMAAHRLQIEEVVRGAPEASPEAEQWVQRLKPQASAAWEELYDALNKHYGIGNVNTERLMQGLDRGISPEELLAPSHYTQVRPLAPLMERYQRYQTALRQAEGVLDPQKPYWWSQRIIDWAERDLHDAIDEAGGRNNDRAHSITNYDSLEPEEAVRRILAAGGPHAIAQRARMGMETEVVERLTQAVRRYQEAAREEEATREAWEAVKPRYGTFIVPGGEKYREVLITLPEAGRETRPTPTALHDEIVDEYDKYMQARPDDYPPGDYERYLEYARAEPREAVPEELYRRVMARHGLTITGVPLDPRERVYSGPHWDEPNVLAHIRMDDRTLPTGEKVLFVHEIQSDWHQAGRERGYASLDEYRQDVLAAVRRHGTHSEEEVSPALELVMRQPESTTDSETGWAWKTLNEAVGDEDVDLNRIYDIVDGASSYTFGPVPDAPYKSTQEWMGLAVKRAVDEAVAGDYEYVVFARGDQIQEVVGGLEEGQSEFYDQILPRWTQKYLGKLGSRMEQVEIRTGEAGKDLPFRYVGPELTDEVLSRASEAAEHMEAHELLYEIENATRNLEQRGHILTGRLNGVDPDVRQEVVALLGGSWERVEFGAGTAGAGNPAFRITPQLRDVVRTRGQALYTFPGPIFEALKTTAGQAAAGAGIGAALDQDHPLRGMVAGAGAVLAIKAGMVGKTIGRLAAAERKGALREVLRPFQDDELAALAARIRRWKPELAQQVEEEVTERAVRLSLTPAEIAERDMELLARGPLKPLRTRPGQPLARKEADAIVDAYQQGDRELRHRIVDELEQAMEEAGPAQEPHYARLIDNLESEGYAPALPEPRASGFVAGRHINLGTFALDPHGERRLAEHVRKVVEEEGLDPKVPVTWDQTRAAAREIGINPADVSFVGRQGASRMSGVEMLAVRNQVRENVQGIEEITRALAVAGETMPDAQREMLERVVAEAEAQNDALLARFIRSRSQAGRDLNALKILANQTLDPLVWEARAAKLLRAGGKPFTEKHRATIRSILSECQ